jgi:pimeloyl-ACP methyl ester carboxylesterase
MEKRWKGNAQGFYFLTQTNKKRRVHFFAILPQPAAPRVGKGGKFSIFKQAAGSYFRRMPTIPYTRALLLLWASLLLVAFSGCAAVTAKLRPPPAEEYRLLAQELPSADAQPETPSAEEFSSLLQIARASWPGAVAGEEESLTRYRAALRRLLLLMPQEDWNIPTASLPDSARTAVGRLPIRLVSGSPELMDPRAAAEFVAADQLELRGIPKRVARDGLGVPLVAWLTPDSSLLAQEPGVPRQGMAIPVTAVLSFPQGKSELPELRFIRTLQEENFRWKGRTIPLAKDYSAALAWIIQKGPNRALNLVGLFRPLPHFGQSGLFQLQPFDPDKIPVVFVHGLLSRPETWQAALLGVMNDPEVRQKYQFWFFSYPTGLPVWTSAARLREELDRYQAALAPRLRTARQRRNLQEMVLVGHSMGGLIASLQIRQGGEYLWRQFSDTTMEELPLTEAAAQRLRATIDFQPREDVKRVVFMAVPYRGSPMALRPFARFFAARVAFSLPELAEVRHVLLDYLRSTSRRELAPPGNSLRFLRENSPHLLAILNLPIRPGVQLHSVIGDRGRGDGAQGSDGVVPYRSAHLPGVMSEKIVPSGHNAHSHPQGVEELLRILKK